MYNFRTKRRQNYKDLNSGVSRKVRRTSTGGLSSADTLVSADLDAMLEDTLANEIHDRDCETDGNHASSPKGILPTVDDHEEQSITTACEGVRANLAKCDYAGSANSKPDGTEVTQHVREAGETGSPIDIDHTVSINPSDTTEIIRQDMTGRPLQRLGTTTVRQIK